MVLQQPPKMKTRSLIVVGDETGLIKAVSDVSFGSYSRFGEQSRTEGVVDLSVLGDNLFSVFRNSGVAEIWQVSETTGVFDKTCENFTELNDCVGSVKLVDSAAVLFYSKTGQATIGRYSEAFWDDLSDEHFSMRAESEGSLSGNSSGNNAFSINFHAKGSLSAAASCVGGLAFAGEETDVQVYDNATLQSVWTAKNVPIDKLKLRVPIWITAMTFLRPQQDQLSTGMVFATGTAYKQIRLYDTQSGQRPVHSMEIGEFRVSAIERVVNNERQLYVADCAGGLNLWDLRMCRKLFTLKGCSGSIRDLTMTSNGSHLACVGLDRHLHWYNAKSNKVVHTVYLKNRLNSCIVLPMGGELGSCGGEEGDSELLEDDDRKLRRKRRNLPSKAFGLTGDEDHLETFEDSSDEDIESEEEEDDEEDVDDSGDNVEVVALELKQDNEEIVEHFPEDHEYGTDSDIEDDGEEDDEKEVDGDNLDSLFRSTRGGKRKVTSSTYQDEDGGYTSRRERVKNRSNKNRNMHVAKKQKPRKGKH